MIELWRLELRLRRSGSNICADTVFKIHTWQRVQLINYSIFDVKPDLKFGTLPTYEEFQDILELQERRLLNE